MGLRTVPNDRLVDGEKLDNLPNDVNVELATKVDKVTGKALSTNDYTTIEKDKLASLSIVSILAGAGISVDDTDQENPIVSLALVADENFVTDAEKTVLSNTSGTNTGDQDLYFSHSIIYDDTTTAVSFNRRVQVINFSDDLGTPASRRLDCTWAGDWELILVNDSARSVNVHNNVGSLEHLVQPGIVSLVKVSGNSISPIFFRSLSSSDVTKLSNLSGTNTGDETSSSIKSKLGISTLSGSNTGDQDLSGLATISGTTFTGDVVVPDEAYGAGWNGSNEVPTKNAVYDKIQTIGGGLSWGASALWTSGVGLTLTRQTWASENLALISTVQWGGPSIKMEHDVIGSTNNFANIEFSRRTNDDVLNLFGAIQPYSLSKTSSSNYSWGVSLLTWRNGSTSANFGFDSLGRLSIGTYQTDESTHGGTNGIFLSPGTNLTSITGSNATNAYVFSDSGKLTLVGRGSTKVNVTIPNSASGTQTGQEIVVSNTQSNTQTGLKVELGTSAIAHTWVLVNAKGASTTQTWVKIDLGNWTWVPLHMVTSWTGKTAFKLDTGFTTTSAPTGSSTYVIVDIGGTSYRILAQAAS